MTQDRIIDWEGLPPEVQEQWQSQIACLTIPPLTFNGRDGSSRKKRLEAISRDPALCAKVLVVANSASQGRQSPAASVELAAVQLGQNMLQIIMSGYFLENVIGRFPDYPRKFFDFVRNWSAISAITAFHFSGKLGLENRGVISTAALIARLGSLALGLTWPAPDQKYFDLADETQRYSYEMEKWRVSTPLMGQQICLHWGLPEPLPTYIKRQDIPLFAKITDSYEDQCALVMCVASVVAAAYMLNPQADPVECLSKEHYTQLMQNVGDLEFTETLRATWDSKILKREIQSIKAGF